MGCTGTKDKKDEKDDGADPPIEKKKGEAPPTMGATAMGKAESSPPVAAKAEQPKAAKNAVLDVDAPRAAAKTAPEVKSPISPRSKPQILSPKASLDEHIYALRHVSTKYLAADFEQKNGPRTTTSSDKIVCQAFWRATKMPQGYYLLENMGTGGFISADERNHVKMEIEATEACQWICQATKGGSAKRVHFKHLKNKLYLCIHPDGRWIIADGPDEGRTGFDLELLKTISNNVMRSFDLHAVDGRADTQVFTDILHRQCACALTYSKDMAGVAHSLHALRLLDAPGLIDIQARTYHAMTTKIMKELPLLSDRLFKFLDINDDMLLSRSEFEIILSLVPQSCISDVAEDRHYRALFNIMDADHSGKVVREEVVEFFRALFTCLVDFLHMGVDIAKKTVNQIYVPRLVEVAIEALDEDGDGSVSVPECMGFMEELLHRDPSIRDSFIRFQYAMFGDNSDPDAKANNKAQLDAEGHILVDILNLVGQEGMDRKRFLDMMSHLGDNAVNRMLSKAPKFMADVPKRMEATSSLLPLLGDQFNRLVRSKKDDLFSAYFRVLDRNNDGQVERHEFEMAVKLLQPGTAEEKAALMHEIFDINGDGQISAAEATTLFTSLVNLIAEFAHIVIDVSIKLLNEEIVEEIVWSLTDAYSEDHIGLDYNHFKEFCEGVKTDLMLSFANPMQAVRDYPDLFDIWQGLALEAGADLPTVQQWWGFIMNQYKDEKRTYHNINHLRDMFRLYSEIKEHLKDKLSVGLAIFFHEIVYHPLKEDNEILSAKECEGFAKSIKMDKALHAAINGIILHGHDIRDAPDSAQANDLEYFMDLKLAVLGRDAEEYDQYVRNIREEYTFLDENEFLMSRAQVLKQLLDTQIYRTKPVQAKYEKRARRNVERELQSLSDAGYTASP